MTKAVQILQKYEAVIGLEVHIELTKLHTKMFCGCEQVVGDAPNTHTCPVCLGLPGALPVPNQAAIESIILAGLATKCSIMPRSMFYRKNYFYPDMAKNFQTTQGPVAFCMNGAVDLALTGQNPRDLNMGSDPNSTYTTTIGITRIHMEEDAGKLTHMGGDSGRIADANYSLVDYNRAGIPLIELVTEPDLRSPAEARSFLQKLRTAILALNISDCSMEQGSLRCDGNVSLRLRGQSELGTKTELKNMNSFKNLFDGLSYEIERQAAILDEGGTVVQETRHWEPAKKKTIGLRVKETADDYRFFPEPDMVPFDLSADFIDSVRAKLPELPEAKAARYQKDYGLNQSQTEFIISEADLLKLLEDTLILYSNENNNSRDFAKQLVNILQNEIQAYLNSNNSELSSSKLSPELMLDYAVSISSSDLTSSQKKELVSAMAESGQRASEQISQLGLDAQCDDDELAQLAHAIMDQNPAKVAEYRAGKTGLIGFFVGQAVRESGGKANPKALNEILVKLLS